MELTFVIMNIIAPLVFLVIEFLIYKSKFNKFAKTDTPSNLKLAIDIVLLAVLGYISMILLGFILGLLMLILLPLAGIVGILTPVIVIIIYYFILKFLAGRHTSKGNAKKISDQTLVFTILFGIVYYLILSLLLLPIISSSI